MPLEGEILAEAGPPVGRSMRARLGRVGRPEAVGVVLLLALFGIGSLVTPGFASLGNVTTIGALSMLLAVASLGQTFVILSGSGGIDLSVGSVMSLCGVLAAQLMAGSEARFVPVAVGVVLFGAALGTLSGLGIAYLRIPPLVMTLGMAGIADGIALVYTQGEPGGAASPPLVFLGSGHIFGIPTLIPLGVLLALLGQFVLQGTGYGRMLRLVGTNPSAARVARIPVRAVVIGTYALSGALSALAGLVLLGYTVTSYLGTGAQYQLASIAAVVVGGVPLSGGQGGFGNTILGALIVTVINTILVSLHMAEGGREIVDGVILLAVLSGYALSSRARRGSRS